MTSKELAIDILHKIETLHRQNAALKAILSTIYPAPGQALNWEPMMKEIMSSRTVQGSADVKYAHIEQSILESQDDHSAMLALLIPLLSDVL